MFHQNIRKKCNSYYFRFIFCEMINVVVVLVGFGMTNRFLEYRWQDYGFQVKSISRHKSILTLIFHFTYRCGNTTVFRLMSNNWVSKAIQCATLFLALLHVLITGSTLHFSFLVTEFIIILPRFGQGGFQENIEALCILSLNVVNEKIFFVIWWWFLTLFIIDVAQIGFRVAQIFSARLRCYLLKRRIQRWKKLDYYCYFYISYVICHQICLGNWGNERN